MFEKFIVDIIVSIDILLIIYAITYRTNFIFILYIIYTHFLFIILTLQPDFKSLFIDQYISLSPNRTVVHNYLNLHYNYDKHVISVINSTVSLLITASTSTLNFYIINLIVIILLLAH